jgi:hypothetical protein
MHRERVVATATVILSEHLASNVEDERRRERLECHRVHVLSQTQQFTHGKPEAICQYSILERLARHDSARYVHASARASSPNCSQVGTDSIRVPRRRVSTSPNHITI